MRFSQITRKTATELLFDNISYEINKLKDYHKSEISNAKDESYKEGFSNGFTKGFDLGNSNVDITDIDYNSIKKFAEWCYINGIDFSYMAKSTDTIPFDTRVINKFKDEIEKDVTRNGEKEENN